MRHTYVHKLLLLSPALAWLFIQFAMAGVMTGSSANANQIEICSSFGIQQATIDPETGEPIEPVIGGADCDWCQSFSQIADTNLRGDVGWRVLGRSFQYKLALSPPPHKPLRLVAGYQSRGPPIL